MRRGSSRLRRMHVARAMAGAKVFDFARGWPNPLLLQGSLPSKLSESFQRGLALSSSSLNYGDASHGSYRFGHPEFLEALAGFLQKQYGAPVESGTLMATGGASMGIDLAMRLALSGVCGFEEPSYYLPPGWQRQRVSTSRSFNMARDHRLVCQGVRMQEDGLDLQDLERLCQEEPLRWGAPGARMSADLSGCSTPSRCTTTPRATP